MRFLSRHTQKTIAKDLETLLANCGWTGATPNWGISPFNLVRVEPEEVIKLEPNTVAISLGDEQPFRDFELGGYSELNCLLFIDVIAEKPSIARSVASDIRDRLDSLTIPLLDFTTDPNGAVTTNSIEFEDVQSSFPEASILALDLRRGWRVVTANAVVIFQD